MPAVGAEHGTPIVDVANAGAELTAVARRHRLVSLDSQVVD